MKDIKTAVTGAVSKHNILDKIQKVGLSARSSWLSSKLGVTLAVVLGLIYLLHGQVIPILNNIQWIVITFLIVRGVEDSIQHIMTGRLQAKALELFAKDGLTQSEVDAALGDNQKP